MSRSKSRQALRQALAFALEGLRYAVRTQRAFRIQLVITAVICVVLLGLRMPALECSCRWRREGAHLLERVRALLRPPDRGAPSHASYRIQHNCGISDWGLGITQIPNPDSLIP